MKRYAFWILMALLALMSLACRLSGPNDISEAPVHPPGQFNSPPVTNLTLPEGSPYLGSFEAKRVNQLQFWTETDEFDKEGARVGTRFLSELTLSAKSGCHWDYKPEGTFSREGYYLNCDK